MQATYEQLKLWCERITADHGEECFSNGCPFGKPMEGSVMCICDKYGLKHVPEHDELVPYVEKLKRYANGEVIE